MKSSFLYQRLLRFEETVGILLSVLVFGAIALQVITRFVFRAPLFWTEEAARYLFVWMVAMGSAECVRSRSHISMDVFVLMLPDRLRIMLRTALNMIVVVALLMLVWYGYFGMLRANRVVSVTLGVSEAFLYGALPVGAALMALRMIIVIIENIRFLITGQISLENRDTVQVQDSRERSL
nr:TRAP transporter small permease [uncultured Cohaesibacter sp.]